MQAANTAGKCSGNAAPTASRASRKAPRPAARSAAMARATTSRGASSAERVIAGHEGLAVAVHQARAFSAQGLGGQGRGVGADVDGGGMELDELGIVDARADGGGQGQALAAHGGRIGGDRIEAAEAAGRQDGGRRDDLHAAPA